MQPKSTITKKKTASSTKKAKGPSRSGSNAGGSGSRPAFDKKLESVVEKSVYETINKESVERLMRGSLNSSMVKGGFPVVHRVCPLTGSPNHLFTHQRKGVKELFERLHTVDWMINSTDMGLGKTVMGAILYACMCFERNDATDPTGDTCLLVVAPKSVVDCWRSTLLRWIRLKESQLTFDTSSVSEHTRVVITTYDTVRIAFTKAWFPKTEGRDTLWTRKEGVPLPPLFEWARTRVDFVMFDESHRLRNPKASTTIAHKILVSTCRPRTKKLMCTGTVVCNTPKDAASQIAVAGETGIYSDASNWGDKHRSVNVGAINFLREHMIRIPERVVDLPPMFVHNEAVDVARDPVVPWERYQALKVEAYDTYLQSVIAIDSDQPTDAKLIALYRKLDLILLHPLMVDIPAKTVRASPQLLHQIAQTPTRLMQAFVSKLSNMAMDGTHSVVVCSQSVTVLYVASVTLKQHLVGIELCPYFYTGDIQDLKQRRETIDKFLMHTRNDDGRLHVFFLSMKAGGEGINLVPGPTTMIILPPVEFNPMSEMQAVKRVHRIGCTNPVNVYHMYPQHGVSEAIQHVNDDKIYVAMYACESITVEKTDNPHPEGVDEDGDTGAASFRCKTVEGDEDKSFNWKEKSSIAQNIWNYDVKEGRFERA